MNKILQKKKKKSSFLNNLHFNDTDPACDKSIQGGNNSSVTI